MLLNIKLKHKTTYKRATSLVEVLIILAIISTAILATTTLAVNSQKRIIQNQREDTANGILVQAIEIIKSPADVVIDQNVKFINGQTVPFSLSSTNETFVLSKEDTPMTSCTQSSPYLITGEMFNAGEINFTICLELRITFIVRDGAQNYYDVQARIAYQDGVDLKVIELNGFRTENFVPIGSLNNPAGFTETNTTNTNTDGQTTF